ncbi:lipolytic protein G-D-S-L family [Pseudarthrobacter chlorophenolicus A6]|uniref:Lipolytic protein G-D-S-L family n=1 Tax=Pseudarthrobacter chlorophenolicus (strain ATCC 700700 / DSM 12829 / CIP 107037 / JCM 12360 / KCTC 9906 / NCIMB 13794 / A6) TaxID=452863 RepID=B8HGR3_PSECP|nr:GDSL-type esterase/lipase family protein [Pseudarthrobacter chlorophenolicus]ACL41329.1 lipolytic protein G-D-S-L family [Pseudarthrobacter chlorophenolicus A6]SDQ66133.1 Lysophospholipase L1 [Pseudarthrobacter chlorophenolicus]
MTETRPARGTRTPNYKKPLACCLAATALASGTGLAFSAPAAQAEPSNYRFDFGSGPVEKGYTGVSAADAYTPERRYGFNTPEHMANVSAKGNGVGSDAVRFLEFGTKSSNTFNVDLKEGLYRVTVTLGDTSRASVAAEGVFQEMNLTGNGATASFEIPVTDGQLNLLVTEGKVGTAFTLSALDIEKVSRHPQMDPTIWVGGDSTVASYYPLDSSAQGGWGQLLPEFVDSEKFDVRNMATGGQIARGFRNDGQLEAILQYSKPGDLFLLEMGINDTAAKNATTEAEFKEIMRDMVRQVAATGATPVLVTPQGRATDFVDGVHSSVDRWYRHSTVALAEEEGIPLVDLNVLSSAYFTGIGPEATLALFMTGDTLHPNRAGATELARIVTADLARQGLQ